MQHTGIVGLVNRLSKPHVIPIVPELLSAIEANNIRFAAWNPGLAHWGDGSRHPAMRAPEHAIVERTEHNDLSPIIALAHQHTVYSHPLTPVVLAVLYSSGMHVPSDLLERYITGQVSEAEAGDIDAHLAVCPECEDRLLRTKGFQSIERAITEAE